MQIRDVVTLVHHGKEEPALVLHSSKQAVVDSHSLKPKVDGDGKPVVEEHLTLVHIGDPLSDSGDALRAAVKIVHGVPPLTAERVSGWKVTDAEYHAAMQSEIIDHLQDVIAEQREALRATSEPDVTTQLDAAGPAPEEPAAEPQAETPAE